MTRTRLPRPRCLTRGFLVALVALAMLTLAAARPGGRVDAAGLRVSAQGDCLRLRGEPGLSGSVIGCVPDGSALVDAGQTTSANGLGWTLVRWGEVIGWVATQYLAPDTAPAPTTPVAPATPVAAPPAVAATRLATASALREPPPGGITVGLAGGVSPRALVAAQPFEVASVAVLDAASGAFQTYIPGAPVNTLGGDAPLPAGAAVFLRRRGDLPASLPAPVAASAVTGGTATALASPAPGGTAVGLAGTGDVAAFVAAQPFAVESLSVWDTPSQRWLTYIAAAPDFVNTLRPGLLTSASVVFAKRSTTSAAPTPAGAAAAASNPAAAPATPAPAATTAYRTVSYGRAAIMFYYCAPGMRSGAVGDGGGFCGYMANGQRVHAGAASCAAAYLGQRFLIAGDPLNRVYTCEDTGSAVTAGHRDIWFADADEGGDWWRVVGPAAEILVIVP